MIGGFEECRRRFEAICEREAEPCGAGQSIGTYSEKRLHRVVKRYICDDPSAEEYAVGRYVADLRIGNMLYEIQTGSLAPLAKKLSYYLEETEHSVTVICPIKAEVMLYRMDPETGELLRKKRSPKKGREIDLLPQLIYVAKALDSPRIRLRVLLLRCDEFRFSDRIRYRREGAYVSELFPRELLSDRLIKVPEDLKEFLPEEEHFTVAEYASWSGMKGRQVNQALRGLCEIGLLTRKAEGRKYVYRCAEEE